MEPLITNENADVGGPTETAGIKTTTAGDIVLPIDRGHSDQQLQDISGFYRYKTNAEQLCSINELTDHELQWKPPLRRKVNVWGEIEYLSVTVRIFSGDAEHDFHAR